MERDLTGLGNDCLDGVIGALTELNKENMAFTFSEGPYAPHLWEQHSSLFRVDEQYHPRV
ncbi:hypothetical protein HALO59_70106 [Halomonas sp. 59]|nr:hypothetical protein HALO156_120229 [Halomonas sp. 156]CAD5293398.1 hypothetical protein HALO113_90106 [Halomonas sp. 113]CAD5294665.1 hypothetical protein HALO59_70106 [Halomonas sp. 59]CAD5297884.1 hypothetical protein HALOI3_80106 [Halomonas sp. I3]VXB66116.1 hypothetical protein HALO153_190106 [Halomonas titanicae]